ncbi:MAG: class I SAM-dependent methyltransferase [Coriobacteriia bacterium]|nr:class I SAM-dependent methyltransferase [Coriobacteriia bacterium]
MVQPDATYGISPVDSAALLRETCDALPAGLQLQRGEQGLALTDGTLCVQADFAAKLARVAPGRLNGELLVRACKPNSLPPDAWAADATAGLGEDAFLLAAAGFQVLLIERNPVMAALLQDALERGMRDPRLAPTTARMHLLHADSTQALPHLPLQPAVVLLDPMFPAKGKSAASKKKMQLLQRLESPCTSEEALLKAALAARPQKVIIKRPLKGPHLAGVKPSYSLKGTTIRYDCLLPASLPRA